MNRSLLEKKFASVLILLFFGLYVGDALYAQTSGHIYKPASSSEGRSILDPNSTGNVFNSGVQFHPLPQIHIEPIGDLRTGAKGGHTDLVSNTSGESATYMYYDSDKEALLFRVRLAGQSKASKGYSFLFNTNFDLFGPKAANFSTTNPGFQFEVVLETNSRIRIYSLNSSGTVDQRELTPIDNYFQKAVSDQVYDGTDNGYFYDFYVPISEIDALPGISFNTGTTFRPVGVTITSARSGISGTISDVGGIEDDLYKSSVDALINIIESTPDVTINTLNQLSAVTNALSTTQAVASTALTVNQAYDAFTPVTASGGMGSYTFTLRNEADNADTTLPAGMNFNTSTGQISGTATATQAQTSYTVSVSDGVSTSAQTFTLTVNAAPNGAGSISDVSLTVAETKIAQGNLNDVFTGGTGALSFGAVSGDTEIVTVSLDANQLSVTGVANGGPVTVTVTATDENGATAQQTFSVTVNVTATRLVVTGSSTQTAGSSQSLTITARDGSNNVATTYTGDKTLTFFGADNAPNETKPTIRDKNGSPVEFGNATTITFTDGVATVDTIATDPLTNNNGSMALFLAETANIGVNDGTINTAEEDRLEVTVSSAAANTIAIAGGNSQTATAGTTVGTSPTVVVTDEYGNKVAGTEVTFAITSGGGSLDATDPNPATSGTNGIATAPGWTLGTTAGTNQMTASVGGLTGSPLTFTATGTAGTLANFVVERSGESGGDIAEQTAGESFIIRITARDAQENTVTGFTSTVDLSLNKNSFQSGGGTTGNFVDGVLSSHSVQINTADTGYQITATQTGETAPTGTSNSFNVVPASGNKIVISTQPVGGASDSTLATQPIVEVQDAVDNRVTSFTGEITVSIHDGNDGTLTGTTSMSAVSGVVTYTDLVLAGLVSQNYILRFAGSELTSANSNAVTVTPGVATRLAITGSSTQVAGISQNLTITAYDSKGNVATGYNGDKAITFNGSSAAPNGTNPTVTNKDGSSVNFGSVTTITFNNGIATVDTGNNGAMTLYNAGSSVIAVYDSDEIKAAGSDRLTVTVNNGSLESFVFTLASPQSNGVAFTETNTLTALDSWGNTVTGFDASVNPVTITTSHTGSISGLGSGENSVLNQEANFTNGVANLTDTIIFTGTAGTGTFTATADGKTGISGSVIINAGTATQIATHEGNNQKATIGTAVSTNPSVIVRDVSNNPVPGVSVTFSITGGGGSLTNATGTTNSSGIYTVDSWTLGSNTGINSLNATITGSDPAISTSFSAEGLPVPDLSINDLLTNNTTPDITGLSNQLEGTEVTITLKDSSGNEVVDGSGSPVSYNGTVDADGNWSITVTNPLAEGEYEITAVVVDVSGATKSVTGSLTIDTTPPLLTVNETKTKSTTPTITGTSNQPEGSEVTITLKDSDGNPVLDGDGNDLSYTAIVDNDGSWSVTVTEELEIAEYTIEATTTDKAGNTTISTGKLIIEEEELIVTVTNVTVPSGRIGKLTTISVTLQDQNGNPVLGRADLLSFGLTGSNGNEEMSGITDNGDGTYSISYTPVVSGEDLISITLDGEGIDGSPFTSIVSDDEWHLEFTQSLNESTEAGFSIGTVIVEVRDSGGNKIEAYSGSISIEVTEGSGGPLATDAELIGTTTVNAVNSIATFSGIIMERAGNDYTLTATADEMNSGISDPFNIVPGPPGQLDIRERDEQADLIDEFLSSFNMMAAAKTQNSTTANNEEQLEGNRIPMYMVILDEFENVTFVEEGDTQVEINSNSPSGRFFLQQNLNSSINQLIIPRNQRITNFYYEDPTIGDYTISGKPTPPAGAREILPGETTIVIRKPGRIRASPNEIFSEINVREEIRILLQDDKGQQVFAPEPGVTITLSSSSTAGQFYSGKSGGAPIVSTLIKPAEPSAVVYYQDSFVGTHTLTISGTGVPNPTDTVQFTIEQAGALSTLSVVGPDTLTAGEQGGVYRLIMQDDFKNEFVADRDLTFDLNFKDGVNTTFYLEEEKNNKLSPIADKQLTIPAGESHAPFYLSQTQAGDKILQVQYSDDQLELSTGKPIHFTPDHEEIILAMVAGNGQQQLVMKQLSEDLRVTIIDQYENPIINREVIFRLKDTPMGASSMELIRSAEKRDPNKNTASKFSGTMEVRVFTDSTGIAEASFVMGDRSGEYIIEASSPNLEPVDFLVTAISFDYMLHQNYSNPFNNVTKIIYEVPELSDVRIEVYDIIGRRIAVLVNETRDMGMYDLSFDASRYGLSTGVYIYRMIARATGNDNGYSMVRRMVYVK